MTRTFKVLSALLSYPTAQLQEAMPELTAAIGREALLDRRGLSPARASDERNRDRRSL